jgi:glycerol-3-phosphate dehydrogenase
MFGWPLGAAAELVATPGDSAEVCANEGAAINIADRIVINAMGIFMAGFCQHRTATGKRQLRNMEGKDS